MNDKFDTELNKKHVAELIGEIFIVINKFSKDKLKNTTAAHDMDVILNVMANISGHYLSNFNIKEYPIKFIINSIKLTKLFTENIMENVRARIFNENLSNNLEDDIDVFEEFFKKKVNLQ